MRFVVIEDVITSTSFIDEIDMDSSVAIELFCSKQQKANSEKNDVESFKTNQFV